MRVLVGIIVIQGGCKHEEKREGHYVISNQYAVEINTWDMPGSRRFLVSYNNIPNREMADEKQLFVIRYTQSDDKSVSYTLRVALNQDEIDSIYLYTQQYLQEFHVDNRIYVDENNRREIYHDGGFFSVAFEHDNKRLEAAQYHVKGFEEVAPVMGQLMRFINRKLPEQFKVY